MWRCSAVIYDTMIDCLIKMGCMNIEKESWNISLVKLVFYVQNTRELYEKEPDECDEDQLEDILVKHKKCMHSLKSSFFYSCVCSAVLSLSTVRNTARLGGIRDL